MYQQVMPPVPFADWAFEVVVAQERQEHARIVQPLAEPDFPVLSFLDRLGVEEPLQLAPKDGLVLLAEQVVESDDELVIVRLAILSGVEEKDVVDAIIHFYRIV